MGMHICEGRVGNIDAGFSQTGLGRGRIQPSREIGHFFLRQHDLLLRVDDLLFKRCHRNLPEI